MEQGCGRWLVDGLKLKIESVDEEQRLGDWFLVHWRYKAQRKPR
jgi:hypothetical protein